MILKRRLEIGTSRFRSNAVRFSKMGAIATKTLHKHSNSLVLRELPAEVVDVERCVHDVWITFFDMQRTMRNAKYRGHRKRGAATEKTVPDRLESRTRKIREW